MFYQTFIQFFKKFWSLVLEPLRHMTGRKNQTKEAIDKKSKLELEKWFESNKHNPYPTNNEVTILALKTNLNAKKVKKWIENKRTRSHFKTNNINQSNFNSDDKIILRKYFNTKTKHPGPEELAILEWAINKDKKKIRAWFNSQRFKEKINNNI